jgi:hypothetical protein
MLLALAERRRKVADTLASHIADRRDPSHITHTVADVLRTRMLAVGCGYPDGNDFDCLRCGPAFKLACGRLPDTGRDRCSQPTISRWENAPTLQEIIRLIYALVDKRYGARNFRSEAWLFRRFRGTCPFLALVHGSRFRTLPLSSRTVASRQSGWRP